MLLTAFFCHLQVTPVSYQPTLTLKLHTKCQSFWYPLSNSMANGMMCYKERHTFFVKCFQTILRCTSQMRGASHSICLHIMGLDVPFSTDTNSQITPKIPDLGTRSIWQMGWCTTRSNNHCLWSVSKPNPGPWGRWEAIVTTSVCQLWATLCL